MRSLTLQEQRKLIRAAELTDCPFWAKNNFWIEDRKSLETGEDIGPGRILLAEHQERIVRAALDESGGKFRWATIIYSCPKKSGKTRIAAMVASWLAYRSGRYAEVYCLANDGKQSADRVLAAIKKSIALGNGSMATWDSKMTRVDLPSGAFIEAVPVDPTGEAGSQPTGSFWSEMWGFRLSAKERLWTEMTIPPTRYGHAIRWVESYAGFVGESPILEQLYDQGVNEGKRHSDFPDLPVYVNERARLFCYWDHEPRMAWQHEAFYQEEAATLTDNAFKRVHRNEWVSSETEAIPIERWDACREQYAPLKSGDRTPLVIALDASVSGDCTAMVAVSRHPRRKEDIAVRGALVWNPPKGGKIDYAETIEKAVRRWCKRYNVVCVAYDPYQLHKLATDLRKEGLGWFDEFKQGEKRAVADKQTYDLVMAGRIAHDGNPDLRQHVQNAAAKTLSEKTLRFVKKAESLKVDLLVALSMAAFQCLRLNLS